MTTEWSFDSFGIYTVNININVDKKVTLDQHREVFIVRFIISGHKTLTKFKMTTN